MQHLELETIEEEGVLLHGQLLVFNKTLPNPVLDYDIVVNQFELQLPHCVHFWTKTLEKCMNSLIPQL